MTVVEVKDLNIHASDLERKDFDAWLQGWCLGNSSHPVDFVPPRYGVTRERLRYKMHYITQETKDLLIKTFIMNGITKYDYPLLSMLDYMNTTLEPKHLEWLWEFKQYRVINEFYYGYRNRDKFPAALKEAYMRRMIPIYYAMTEDERAVYSTLDHTISIYIGAAETDEQYAWLFNQKVPTITKLLLNNNNCPDYILESCKEEERYAPHILRSNTVPDRIALHIISKFNLPLTDNEVSSVFEKEYIARNYVVTIREATEEDKAAKRTIKHRQLWWEKVKREEE